MKPVADHNAASDQDVVATHCGAVTGCAPAAVDCAPAADWHPAVQCDHVSADWSPAMD